LENTLTMNILRVALLSSLALPAFTTGSPATDDPQNGQSVHEHAAPAALVQLVRDATRPFRDDIDAAGLAGYGQFLGCVSGPQEGAMGVHYVNMTLVGDNEIDASQPEALLYEFSKGRAHLLGVEYIVDAAKWLENHSNPPVLEGQSFQYVGSPNRFNLDPFFELHVWAWRDNPHGAFVDWNTEVSCEGR
jgi:hypothetical protein